MRQEAFQLDGRSIRLYRTDVTKILFLQPVDAHDASLLDREIDAMRDCALPFALAAFEVRDWNRELSPWAAPPVFGKEAFGGGAAETLRFLMDRLLPELRDRLELSDGIRLCLGGYSLAGLFALWASTGTGTFSAVAAASPSVWFPGWIDYVKEHPIQAPNVYLSLGDREERTRTPVMARVGDCMRELYTLLQEDHRTALVWNEGNHFRDPELRTAKAFLWAAARETE